MSETEEADAEGLASDFEQRYGPGVAKRGFTPVPNVLLDDLVKRKDLDPTQTLVLIKLLRHWIVRHRWPFPGHERIANDIGVSSRTVGRAVKVLREKGLIETNFRHLSDSRNRTSDEYDLRPLIVMLHALEEDRHGRQITWDDKIVEI